MSPLARARQRGVVADAMVAAGATMLLLQSTAATSRSSVLTAVGIALVLIGLVALWGVPRPSVRLRMLSSVPGLLAGYALVAPQGPGTLVAGAAALVLLAALVRGAGRD